MASEKWMSFLSRALFLASFLLLLIAVVERLVNYLGYTIVGGGYAPGRMLEFAGIMLLFVIAILLRQAREELRRKAA
jgi:hypothetical protein